MYKPILAALLLHSLWAPYALCPQTRRARPVPSLATSIIVGIVVEE